MDYRLALRYDYDLHVLGKGNNSPDKVSGQRGKPAPVPRPCKKDLRNLISAREIHQRRSGVLTFEDSSFYVQVAREVQVPVNGFAVAFRQSAQIAGCLNGHGKALGAEKITHALGATNQHRSLGIRRHVNKDPVMLTFSILNAGFGMRTGFIVPYPVLDFVRGLAEREFPKRNQCRLAKEIPHRLFGLRRAEAPAAVEPVQQSARS